MIRPYYHTAYSQAVSEQCTGCLSISTVVRADRVVVSLPQVITWKWQMKRWMSWVVLWGDEHGHMGIIEPQHCKREKPCIWKSWQRGIIATSKAQHLIEDALKCTSEWFRVLVGPESSLVCMQHSWLRLLEASTVELVQWSQQLVETCDRLCTHPISHTKLFRMISSRRITASS